MTSLNKKMIKRMARRCATLIVSVAALHSLASNAQQEIIGGKTVQAGQYPWMAAIYYPAFGAVGAFCGGSLIASRWILTAAHCVEGRAPADIGVALNTTDLRDRSGERLAVKRIIGHPDWFELGITTHDMALLELAEDSQIEPVSLESERSTLVRTGRLSTTIGWGWNGRSYPFELQELSVPITNFTTCARNYLSKGYLLVDDVHICAGFASGGRDSCSGDSGGPLFIQNRATGTETLVGIVRLGYGCALRNYPGVYNKISTRRDWIERQINGTATAAETTDLNPNFARIEHHCFGLQCTVDGRGTLTERGAIVDYQWDMGDGTTLSGPVVTHTYTSAGSDTVALTTTMEDGSSDTVYRRVRYDESRRNDFKRKTNQYSGSFSSDAQDRQIVPRKRSKRGMWLYPGGVTATLTSQTSGISIDLERYDIASQGWVNIATSEDNQVLSLRVSAGFHRFIISPNGDTGTWSLSINARRISAVYSY